MKEKYKSVTIVIPTLNRLYAIKKTIESYLVQDNVKEIIYVDDGGTVGLKEFIEEVNNKTNNIELRYLCNKNRSGAAYSRNVGIDVCSSEFILFGEDDAYLSDNYVSELLDLFNDINDNSSIVSGQIVMLQPNELLDNAKIRYFNQEVEINSKIFDKYTWTLNFDKRLKKEIIRVPYTHALFMCKTDRLKSLKFDEYYNKGNGYREESDFQMNSFCSGGYAYITEKTLCYHMARSDVPSGGQRLNRLKQYYYCVKYNSYFLDKYHDGFCFRNEWNKNIKISKLFFSVVLFFKMFIYPVYRLFLKELK